MTNRPFRPQTGTAQHHTVTRRAALLGAAAMVAAAAAPAELLAAPRGAEPAREIRRGDTSQRNVSLSFDAGADRGYTELILDTLAEYGVTASFGMTGEWAGQNAALVRRMAADGHQFINHTWDHRSWTGLSTQSGPMSFEERRSEVGRVEEILGELAGVNPQPLFRSPFGDTDASVLRDLGTFGYTYNILWTVDSRGWLKVPAGEIVRHCLANAVNGAIYVMHVGGQSQDGPALAPLIEGLRAQGYDFATVSKVLGL